MFRSWIESLTKCLPSNNVWWDTQNTWFLRFLPSSLNQLIILEVCILHGSLFQYFLCGTLLVAHVANLTCCVSYFADWQLWSAGALIELTDPALTVWTVTLSLPVNTWRWDLCDIATPPPSLPGLSLPFLLLCSHPALFSTQSDQNTFLWKDLVNSSHCELLESWGCRHPQVHLNFNPIQGGLHQRNDSSNLPW